MSPDSPFINPVSIKNKTVWSRILATTVVAIASFILYNFDPKDWSYNMSHEVGGYFFIFYLVIPFVVFAVLSAFLRHTLSFSLGLFFMAIMDFSFYTSLMTPSSSTAGIAMLFQPPFLLAAAGFGIFTGYTLMFIKFKYAWVLKTLIVIAVSLLLLYLTIPASMYATPETFPTEPFVDSGVINATRFSPYNLDFVEPEKIDIGNDGKFEYVAEGGGYQDVGIKDEFGNFIWKFQPDQKLSPNRLTYGDLDDNNEYEFYVADHTGLYQLDQNGNIIRVFSDSMYYDVEVYKSNSMSFIVALRSIPSRTLIEAVTQVAKDGFINVADGTDSALGLIKNIFNAASRNITLNDQTEYEVYDQQGELIITFPSYKSEFDFAFVKFMNQPVIVTGFFGDSIVFLDLKGNKLASYDLGTYATYHGPEAKNVQFRRNEDPYVAILSRSSSGGKTSQITIFSSEGEMVFEQVFRARVPEIWVRNELDGSQKLFFDSGKFYDGNDIIFSAR